MENIERIIGLFHYRWAVPVLAELSGSGGSKMVSLSTALGVSKQSLRLTLPGMIEQGWITRNLGYGHPMRPEIVLTPAGAELSPLCREFVDRATRLGIEDVVVRKWPMPVVTGIGKGLNRFSQLRDFLPKVTSRALTQALRGLQEAKLVVRHVVDASPPATSYSLLPPAKSFVPILSRM